MMERLTLAEAARKLRLRHKTLGQRLARALERGHWVEAAGDRVARAWYLPLDRWKQVAATAQGRSGRPAKTAEKQRLSRKAKKVAEVD